MTSLLRQVLQAASSCPEALSPDGPVVRPSGTSLCLGPGHAWTVEKSFEWKVQLRSRSYTCVLHPRKNDSSLHGARRNASDCTNRLNFSIDGLRLLLKAAQPEHSGTYSLEVTNETGKVTTHSFNVSVLGECPSLCAGWCLERLPDQNLCFQTLLGSPSCSCWSGRRTRAVGSAE